MRVDIVPPEPVEDEISIRMTKYEAKLLAQVLYLVKDDEDLYLLAEKLNVNTTDTCIRYGARGSVRIVELDAEW